MDVKHHVYLRTYMLLEERRYKPMLGVWGLGGVAPAVGELWVGVGVGWGKGSRGLTGVWGGWV